MRTAQTWKRILEKPGPMVLGSSQMVSCFGPSCELAFEMDAELRRRKMRHAVPIVSQAIEEVAPGEIRLKDGTKIPFSLAMIAPPFKGVPAVAPLGNPRGFIPVDKQFRHTKYQDVFAVGVAMAIAPPEQTPVPVGVPKTGFMTVKKWPRSPPRPLPPMSPARRRRPRKRSA